MNASRAASQPQRPQPQRKDSSVNPKLDPKAWRVGGFIFSGIVVVLLLVAGAGVWAATFELEGAVPASAELRVQSRPKPVAHPDGGVVGDVLVREGDAVQAGDVLLRLDSTAEQAGLSIVENQIEAFAAQQSRLKAERDGESVLRFPRDLTDAAEGRPDLALALRDQQRLFQARREGFEQTVAQLGERIRQLDQQINGARSRIRGQQARLQTVRQELERHRSMLSRGYSTIGRVNELDGSVAEIEGEIGALQSEIGRLEGQQQETRLQITAARENRREQAIAELREVETRLDELRERRLVAADTLAKIELVAPQTGVVQNLAVHAAGAVLERNEVALIIVPVDDRLVLEARLPTVRRDSVYMGQTARVRFPSFDQRSTPQIEATVTHISPDRLVDQQTGAPYYLAELEISDAERDRLGEDALALVPGMPAEVSLNTGSRSVLSYLIKPLSDNWAHALREN